MAERPWTDRRGLARLLGELWRDRSLVIVAALAALVLAVTTALYPLGLELITAKLLGVDVASSGRWGEWSRRLGWANGVPRLEAYLWPGFIMLVAVKGTAQAVHLDAWGRATQRAVFRLRTRLFDRLLSQSPGFFARRPVGDLAGRFAGDIDDIERSLHVGVPVMAFDSVRFFALATVAVLHYPGLLRVALVVFIAAVVPIVVFGRWLRRQAMRGQQARGTVLQRIVEAIGGISVIHAFDAKAAEAGRFAAAQDRYLDANLRMIRLRALHSPVMEMLGVGAIVATVQIALGGGARVPPSEAVGFLLAMVLMYEPLKNLGRLNAALVPGLSAAQRLYEVIDQPSEITEPSTPRLWTAPPRRAQFSDVWFRYGPGEPDVLRGLNLRLDRGRITGLAGLSGSGKTTVASLLPRLYDVTAGRVEVGGIDVRNLSLRELRSKIAVVTQDAFLFNASVRDNIAYGLPEATDADIRAAARRARADDFIEDLRDGYATVCGDRGVCLSGGQRQRLAVARAFLKNAPLLILDEATSALDAANERAIQDALTDLMDDRAVLLIAHRSSTLACCDEIIELVAGQARPRGYLTAANDRA